MGPFQRALSSGVKFPCFPSLLPCRMAAFKHLHPVFLPPLPLLLPSRLRKSPMSFLQTSTRSTSSKEASKRPEMSVPPLPAVSKGGSLAACLLLSSLSTPASNRTGSAERLRTTRAAPTARRNRCRLRALDSQAARAFPSIVGTSIVRALGTKVLVVTKRLRLKE